MNTAHTEAKTDGNRGANKTETLDPETNLNHALALLRRGREKGEITDVTQIPPALKLRADPALVVGGSWRSPSGRLLELEVTTAGAGAWIALHVPLDLTDLKDYAWVGLTCRSVAPKELVIQPCLRSGTQNGFVDCFFGKHILTVPKPLNYVDALHIETHSALPETALWRELILFLPKQGFRWDLHDLRLFVI